MPWRMKPFRRSSKRGCFKGIPAAMCTRRWMAWVFSCWPSFFWSMGRKDFCPDGEFDDRRERARARPNAAMPADDLRNCVPDVQGALTRAVAYGYEGPERRSTSQTLIPWRTRTARACSGGRRRFSKRTVSTRLTRTASPIASGSPSHPVSASTNHAVVAPVR